MTKTKIIFLLRERRETWLVRSEKNRSKICERCGEETVWLTRAEAAQVSDLSERRNFCLEDDGKIHFKESGSGLLFRLRRIAGTIRKF